ncbi:MAG: hypothetical protein ACFFDN_00785 [Candidatus Hodarchaeota archaeon]
MKNEITEEDKKLLNKAIETTTDKILTEIDEFMPNLSKRLKLQKKELCTLIKKTNALYDFAPSAKQEINKNLFPIYTSYLLLLLHIQITLTINSEELKVLLSTINKSIKTLFFTFCGRYLMDKTWHECKINTEFSILEEKGISICNGNLSNEVNRIINKILESSLNIVMQIE